MSSLGCCDAPGLSGTQTTELDGNLSDHLLVPADVERQRLSVGQTAAAGIEAPPNV